MLFVSLQKRVRVKKELTFQDMYQNQDLFDQDDDDDEDDDWDPSQKQADDDDGVGQTSVSDVIDEVSEPNPLTNAVSVFSNY
jgi:hypothetical protein